MAAKDMGPVAIIMGRLVHKGFTILDFRETDTHIYITTDHGPTIPITRWSSVWVRRYPKPTKEQ